MAATEIRHTHSSTKPQLYHPFLDSYHRVAKVGQIKWCQTPFRIDLL